MSSPPSRHIGLLVIGALIPIASAEAGGATELSIGADAISRFVRPDFGDSTVNAVGTGLAAGADRIPYSAAVAPITNEMIEAFKSTDLSKAMAAFINKYFESSRR